MSMKRLISRFGRLAAAGVIVVASVAGIQHATTAVRAAGPTIYVIGYETQNPFWQTEQHGAQQAGADFGVNVIYQAPAVASTAGMEQLARAAIAARPQGLAIDYTDRGMEKVTLAALQAGIKVVLYNNNRFENTGQPGSATTDVRITGLAYSGQDEHHSGTVLGQAFLKYLKPHAKVLIVNPFPQAFVLTLRYQGVKSVLQAAGISTDLIPAGADEGNNMSLIGAYLQAHPDTGGIVGLGDPAANPAATYVMRKKLSIPVATFDVDTEAVHLIQAGALTVALNQQPWLQSYHAVQNLVFALKYGLTPVNVDTGTLLVNKSNVDNLVQVIHAGRG
ncbi:MAG TPA: substrate-binding domain-containing protein [Chloroflexota bacterium]|jgi:simple sugar transport system substrate-binding protein|nr:substrate-binding domain-containing protein [Chloroflexota bacterium]